ncbi:MAG TPA: dTDP-4-dehydrorhamnose reductase, partial [Saprospiraceae bacterium]|nr:dTDP-4-dehydrorhamnose reductase [Saprospiraceae bacterium]
QLDISDQDKINRILQLLPQAQYWINCAAYTKVDDAETNIREATLYNSTAPGFIAQACKARGIHLIHFSSDYVYHNQLRRPLLEDDPTNPQGIYATTKREGEIAIRNIGGSHTIIRTSWVYGPGGHNFVNTMLRLGKTREQLSIVGDQLGAPTLTMDLAEAVKELILLHSLGKQEAVQGIFNYANAGEVTWDEFARAIFRMENLNCQVKTITTAEYGAAAPRPPYSVLNCDKIQKLLSTPIPSWENALTRYLASVPK